MCGTLDVMGGDRACVGVQRSRHVANARVTAVSLPVRNVKIAVPCAYPETSSQCIETIMSQYTRRTSQYIPVLIQRGCVLRLPMSQDTPVASQCSFMSWDGAQVSRVAFDSETSFAVLIHAVPGRSILYWDRSAAFQTMCHDVTPIHIVSRVGRLGSDDGCEVGENRML